MFEEQERGYCSEMKKGNSGRKQGQRGQQGPDTMKYHVNIQGHWILF